MAKTLNRLTARFCETISKPGRYADGAGLYLSVLGNARSWLLRYQRAGKEHWHGLGSATSVSLAEARKKAQAVRDGLRAGVDPLIAKRGAVDDAGERASAMLFKEALAAYLKTRKFSNERHAAQWTSSLSMHASSIMNTDVSAISDEDVLEVLNPIWREIPETASRVRGRIEMVLEWATAAKHRTGDNPARWSGHLKILLGGARPKSSVKHHTAMDYREMPDLMMRLRAMDGSGARALEVLILTAARTSEVLGMQPEEIDERKALWTVPPERMKARRAHLVPLSPRALEIVHEARGHFELSGEAMRRCLQRLGLTVTVHGFRSSFKQWATEVAGAPWEVTEAALAHTLGSEVAQAYYRTAQMLDRRRPLMLQWAAYCESTTKKRGPSRSR